MRGRFCCGDYSRRVRTQEASTRPLWMASVDVNILCRLFQHQCPQRAVCQGLIAIEAPSSEFLLFSLQHWVADGDIDC
jgi:hypothetical protein